MKGEEMEGERRDGEGGGQKKEGWKKEAEEGRAERGGREGRKGGEEGREGEFTSLLLPDNNGGPQLTRIHLKACLYKLCQLHSHSHMELSFTVQVPEKRDAY